MSNLKFGIMKTVKLIAFALSICLCAACTTKKDTNIDSQNSQDTAEAPGVGVAPDNSRSVPDSTTTQQVDTASINKK